MLVSSISRVDLPGPQTSKVPKCYRVYQHAPMCPFKYDLIETIGSLRGTFWGWYGPVLCGYFGGPGSIKKQRFTQWQWPAGNEKCLAESRIPCKCGTDLPWQLTRESLLPLSFLLLTIIRTITIPTIVITVLK